MSGRGPATVIVASVLLGWCAGAQDWPAVTHGVASGDVSSTGAVIWARADREADMRVRVLPLVGASAPWSGSARATSATNLAAQVLVTGLRPATAYRYEVWFERGGARSESDAGMFRTAPADDVRAPSAIVWGGDLGGQGYCRKADAGYDIFQAIAAWRPDYFVANGDMIYGDGTCAGAGPEPGWKNVPGTFPSVDDASVDWRDAARVEQVYADHWLYNRADPAFQDFLRATPMYVQWDDHEVINDFGAQWPSYGPSRDRAGFANLVAGGRKTFFDFHPLQRHSTESGRIYRSFRLGRDVELFLLDARSYRSENSREDTTDGKTMLGKAQVEWIAKALSQSTATWKIVSSDVPLSISTGSRPEVHGRDAFANGVQADFSQKTGFERELLAVLRALDAGQVRNVVFVTTDVHFAAQVRYEGDFDGDGDRLVFHELLSGPLSAGKTKKVPALDPTLNPMVLYSEGDIFNFGTLRIGDASPDPPAIWTDIRDERGRIRPGSARVLTPEGAEASTAKNDP